MSPFVGIGLACAVISFVCRGRGSRGLVPLPAEASVEEVHGPSRDEPDGCSEQQVDGEVLGEVDSGVADEQRAEDHEDGEPPAADDRCGEGREGGGDEIQD